MCQGLPVSLFVTFHGQFSPWPLFRTRISLLLPTTKTFLNQEGVITRSARPSASLLEVGGMPARVKVTAPYHELFSELDEVRHANLATATKHDGCTGHCVLFDCVVRER
jgi:hypothetical protein